MKPVSGVKPPMPSMMMSPFSRELTRSLGSDARAGELGREGIALEQQRLELSAPVGANQTGHVAVLCEYADGALHCADALAARQGIFFDRSISRADLRPLIGSPKSVA